MMKPSQLGQGDHAPNLRYGHREPHLKERVYRDRFITFRVNMSREYRAHVRGSLITLLVALSTHPKGSSLGGHLRENFSDVAGAYCGALGSISELYSNERRANKLLISESPNGFESTPASGVSPKCSGPRRSASLCPLDATSLMWGARSSNA